MKNTKLYISLLSIALIGLTSCKNDLDVLAPGEESVSVYGVLNPNETTQNIRINKVYLTTGDAVAAGQDNNQINYAPGELEVSLERYVDGVQTNVNFLNGILNSGSPDSDKRIVLTETVVTTASGNFNANQRIWQTNKKIFTLAATNTKPNVTIYKLKIKINSTGREIKAENLIMDSVLSSSIRPFIYNATLHPMHGNYLGTTQQSAYIDYSNLTFKPVIKFKSLRNARSYNVVMRFHYIDSISGSTVVNPKFADFNFPIQKSSTLLGGEDLEVSFQSSDFYTTIAGTISKDQVAGLVNRRSVYMEYIIRAGAETLNTFLLVNQPSTTIAQDKPYYTNIDGGVGVFSCSSRSIITHDLATGFIDKIACHPSTYPLQFIKSDGSLATSACN